MPISVQEALKLITNQAKSFGHEYIYAEEALGRVICQHTATALNHFSHSSAISAHPAEYVHTSYSYAGGASVDILPDTGIDDYLSKLITSFSPSSSVFAKNNKLVDARHLQAHISSGHYIVEVEKLPEVAIVSTGNEIVPATSAALPHQIRDSNSYMIASFLKKFQIHSPAKVLVPDDKIALRDTISALLDKDILIISGGVSKGEADYVPEVLVSLGVEEIFHSIKIKPGAPLWFGRTASGGVVFGLPGNPLAVQIACRKFVEEFLATCLGISSRSPLWLPLATERLKKSKFDEYFPCKIVNNAVYSGLLPVRHNGSGDINAAFQSEGIALQTELLSHLEEGAYLPFYFW